MDVENFDDILRRLKFVEACSSYLVIRNVSIDDLKMTSELSGMLTDKLHQANIRRDISVYRYQKFLNECLKEKGLPDIGDNKVDSSTVAFYDFRSMVVKMAADLRKCMEPMDVNENVILVKTPLPSSPGQLMPSSPVQLFPSESLAKRMDGLTARYDMLRGFSVQIKPEPHLDESIPICARDQHLLFNIFGEQWNCSTILNAYTAIKGQTGFMSNWASPNGRKSNGWKS